MITLCRGLMIAMFALCFTCAGAEWVSKEAGVSFQLPSDTNWVQITGPRAEARLVVQRTDHTASVAFIAFEKKAGTVLDEGLVNRWETGFYRKGNHDKVSGEFFTFKGKHAYKAIDRATKDGVTSFGVVILCVDNERLLELLATKNGSDPLEDQVIKDFFDSTKFIEPAPK